MDKEQIKETEEKPTYYYQREIPWEYQTLDQYGYQTTIKEYNAPKRFIGYINGHYFEE